MNAKVARRQFTVDDYYRMAEAGILGEDDRVELIEGEIVQMAPIGSRHAAVVDRITTLFAHLAATKEVIIRIQSPIRLSDLTEPQPDVTLLRPRADYYSGGHPTGADVLLLIEVADSSLDYDREVKLPLYARAGVPEVWIVDLEGDAVETYTRPAATGYAVVLRVSRGESVSPGVIPSLRLTVDDILG